MGFSNKGRDSKDTARLRAEYEKKAKEVRETTDAASKAKLHDDKQKLWQKVVDQQIAERRENIAGVHKALIGMGKLRTPEQVAEMKAQAEAENSVQAHTEVQMIRDEALSTTDRIRSTLVTELEMQTSEWNKPT